MVGRVLKEWLRTLWHSKGVDDAERKLKPCLKDERCRAVLRLVLENPGITAAALAGRSQLDQAVIGGFLNGLEARGLIVAEKEDDRTGYHIADAAKTAVVKYLPLNYQCPGLQRE